MTLALIVRVAVGPHVRDDAYITLRYAHHLANGLGFTYNVGERVLGTTTPLFTLLLAGLALLGIAPHISAVALGVLADVGVVFCLWYYGRAVASPAVGLLASLIYALMPPIVSYAVSGMETPLYLLLIILAFLLAHERRILSCSAVAAFAALIRPDGLLVVVALVTWILARMLQEERHLENARALVERGAELVRDGLPAIGLFGALVVPWLIFAWDYFGSPVPQSMLAKWELHGVGPFTSIRNFAGYFIELNERWFLPYTVLAIIGGVTKFRDRPETYPLVGWGVAYAAAFLASNKFVYPLMPFEWYFLPLLLPYCLLAAAGWVALVERITARQLHATRAKRGIVVVTAVIFIAAGLVQTAQARRSLDIVVDGREGLYIQIAEHLTSYGVTDDVVAATEIGAFGYHYPGPLLDLWGLVTPSAVGRQTELIATEQPPWVLGYEESIQHDLQMPPWFERHYRPVITLQNWESRRFLLYRWYPEASPTRPVGATMGEVFDLVGRRLHREQTDTKDIFRVELTWRAREVVPFRATVSVQVLDKNGEKLAQQDNEPQEGTRLTTTWHEGELIVDRYDLVMPIAEGRRAHWLTIASYLTETPKERLTWQSPGGTALGTVLYAPVPSRLGTSEGAELGTPCEAEFVGGIRLTDFKFDPTDEGYTLTSTWTTDTPIDQDYAVYVHLVDAEGRLIAQADGPPARGRLPTSIWEPGDRIEDMRLLPVSDDQRAERILVGLYRLSDGQRLMRANGQGDSVTLILAPSPRCE